METSLPDIGGFFNPSWVGAWNWVDSCFIAFDVGDNLEFIFMENEKSNNTLIVLVVIIVIFLFWFSDNKKLENRIDQLSSENEQLLDKNYELEQKVDDYADALYQANDNIENLDNQIENAQYSAWSTYQEMGFAIDELYTLRTVDVP